MKYYIHPSNLLGRSIDRNESYTIVGGGMAGLFAGYYLKKEGIPFTISEKSDRPGGLIHSHKVEGFGIAEEAANGFIWCEELQNICDDIGLEILSPSQYSKNRFLVRGLELRKFPLGIFEIPEVVSKAIRSHPEKLETIGDFGRTFFGKTFTRQIIAPGIAGIYGGEIDKLSFEGVLSSVANQMNHTSSLLGVIRHFRKENKNKKGRKKKLSGTHSFKGGFGQLPFMLASFLKGHIAYNSEENHADGPTILTCPAYVAKDFFQGGIHDLLSQVEYIPFITTTVFVKKKNLSRYKEGFGCLIPRDEGLTILGVLFNACIFPDRVDNAEYVSLTCMMRDEGCGSIFDMEDSYLIQKIIQPDLERLLGLTASIEAYHMRKWKRGIPLYSPSLVKAWPELDQLLKKEYPDIRLLGNYTGQISIRGMAQYIRKAFDLS